MNKAEIQSSINHLDFDLICQSRHGCEIKANWLFENFREDKEVYICHGHKIKWENSDIVYWDKDEFSWTPLNP